MLADGAGGDSSWPRLADPGGEQSAIDFARQNFPEPRLRVTIAEFNRRAQKVWERHGFVPVQRFVANFGKRPFIIYVKELG